MKQLARFRIGSLQCGVLFQPGALWIGAHYGAYAKRWCIQVVPMLTLWVMQRGGLEPQVSCGTPR